MNRTAWNPEWSAAIERITTLVEAMFACRAKFRTLDSFLEPLNRSAYLEQDLVFLESTLFEVPEMIRSVVAGQFAFPLRVRRAGAGPKDVSLVGVATIEGLAASDDIRLKQIAEFLHLAVESRLDAFERLLDIEQREQRLALEQENRESGKVIRLFPRDLDSRNIGSGDNMPRSLSDEASDETVSSYHLPASEAALELSKPLLLVNDHLARKSSSSLGSSIGSSMGSIRMSIQEKIAIEIFNKSGHWFFVGLNDLSDESFRTAHSFRELGRMIVFIPNLAEVSIEKQLRLAEVFAATKGETNAPSVIAFVDEDPKAHVARGTILPHLLDAMAMIHVPAALALSTSSGAPISGHRTFGVLLREITATLRGRPASREGLEGGSVIPLNGRWQHDDGPNPTFH
jgi:hypothetical protein